ncbi:MAG: 4-alpha-glucanotransferase, partial [Spirochaetes bacterium]|nr:4-alpha-glucanotransferase [Spirochaetota bacterium]
MKHTSAAKRSAGAAIPLSGIKIDGGWCVGEYPDLVPFADFCRAGGLDTVQVLPLNDSGRQSSPYAALSAFALHPLYLRVADIPEAAGYTEVLQELNDYAAACNGQAFFNYYEAYDRKMSALEAVYNGVADSVADDKAIRAFVAGHDWLRTYAVYKRLKKLNGDRSWRDWPSYSYPTKAAIDALWKDAKLQREHYFYVWLQYHCALQLQKAADALKAMQIGLLGDLPILMNDDSADVWAERQLFLMDLRAGAPPEGDADLGQNWGFPVYNWDSMAANGYTFWKQRIKEAAKYYS